MSITLINIYIVYQWAEICQVPVVYDWKLMQIAYLVIVQEENKL